MATAERQLLKSAVRSQLGISLHLCTSLAQDNQFSYNENEPICEQKLMCFDCTRYIPPEGYYEKGRTQFLAFAAWSFCI